MMVLALGPSAIIVIGVGGTEPPRRNSEPNAWLSKEITPVVNEFDGEEFAAVLDAIESAAAEVAAN